MEKVLESMILTGVQITSDAFFEMLNTICEDLGKSHEEFVKNQGKQLV